MLRRASADIVPDRHLQVAASPAKFLFGFLFISIILNSISLSNEDIRITKLKDSNSRKRDDPVARGYSALGISGFSRGSWGFRAVIQNVVGGGRLWRRGSGTGGGDLSRGFSSAWKGLGLSSLFTCLKGMIFSSSRRTRRKCLLLVLEVFSTLANSLAFDVGP